MIIIKFRARMSLIWLNVRKINCFIYSKRHFSWFFFREFDEKHGIVRTRRAFFLPVRIYQFTQRPREIVLKTPFTVLFFVCHTHLIPYTILHMYTYFIFLYRYGQIFIYIYQRCCMPLECEETCRFCQSLWSVRMCHLGSVNRCKIIVR